LNGEHFKKFPLIQQRSLIFALLALITTSAHSADVFTGAGESDPDSIVQNVSVIHGDFSKLEIDLCVAGPDPLILSQFYSSQDDRGLRQFGGWRLLPQTMFFICSEPAFNNDITSIEKTESIDIFVGTPEESLLKFLGPKNWANSKEKSTFQIELKKNPAGVCNTARGSPSSRTNIKNHTLTYEPASKSFELKTPLGEKRIYKQKFGQGSFLLHLEILPSGNQVSYRYDSSNRIEHLEMRNLGYLFSLFPSQSYFFSSSA
jgi:hypothetical protein